MRSEIAESAAAGDGGIGHPAPFLVKPAAEGAGMAVDVADARDLAERAVGDLLFEEHVDGLTTHEITGLEDKSFLLNGMGHLPRVRGGIAERFFDVEVLLGGDGLQDEFLVAVRFGADDDGVDCGVVPDVFREFRDGGAELVGGHFCAIRVVVPDFRDFDVLAGGHPLDEIRGVDVAAADECQCFHVGLLLCVVGRTGYSGKTGLMKLTRHCAAVARKMLRGIRFKL